MASRGGTAATRVSAGHAQQASAADGAAAPEAAGLLVASVLPEVAAPTTGTAATGAVASAGTVAMDASAASAGTVATARWLPNARCAATGRPGVTVRGEGPSRALPMIAEHNVPAVGPAQALDALRVLVPPDAVRAPVVRYGGAEPRVAVPFPTGNADPEALAPRARVRRNVPSVRPARRRSPLRRSPRT